jgi:tRNA threonylcarbamoyladenosine biosynthesis protein TsaB
MAIFIALDASTEACSVALVNGSQRLSLSSDTPQHHAQQLLPFIDQILQQADLGIGQLDFIACSQGPGSFTGLRIGLGVAQGLAYGADIPMIGVSSLAALARVAAEALAPEVDSVLTLLDARMGEIYWALYQNVQTFPAVLKAPTLSAPQALLEEIRSARHLSGIPKLALAGSGLSLLELSEDELAGVATDVQLRPHADAVADIAAVLWEQGAVVAPDAFELLYLRNSVSWNKRQRIRTPSSSI